MQSFYDKVRWTEENEKRERAVTFRENETDENDKPNQLLEGIQGSKNV